MLENLLTQAQKVREAGNVEEVKRILLHLSKTEIPTLFNGLNQKKVQLYYQLGELYATAVEQGATSPEETKTFFEIAVACLKKASDSFYYPDASPEEKTFMEQALDTLEKIYGSKLPKRIYPEETDFFDIFGIVKTFLERKKKIWSHYRKTGNLPIEVSPSSPEEGADFAIFREMNISPDGETRWLSQEAFLAVWERRYEKQQDGTYLPRGNARMVNSKAQEVLGRLTLEINWYDKQREKKSQFAASEVAPMEIDIGTVSPELDKERVLEAKTLLVISQWFSISPSRSVSPDFLGDLPGGFSGDTGAPFDLHRAFRLGIQAVQAGSQPALHHLIRVFIEDFREEKGCWGDVDYRFLSHKVKKAWITQIIQEARAAFDQFHPGALETLTRISDDLYKDRSSKRENNELVRELFKETELLPSSSPAEISLKKASTLIQQKRHDEAITVLEEVAPERRSPSLWLNLGKAYLGKFETSPASSESEVESLLVTAIKCLEKAASFPLPEEHVYPGKENEAVEEARVLLGNYHRNRKKDPKAAEEWYQKAGVRGQAGMGQLWEERGDPKRAEFYYKRAGCFGVELLAKLYGPSDNKRARQAYALYIGSFSLRPDCQAGAVKQYAALIEESKVLEVQPEKDRRSLQPVLLRDFFTSIKEDMHGIQTLDPLRDLFSLYRKKSDEGYVFAQVAFWSLYKAYEKLPQMKEFEEEAVYWCKQAARAGNPIAKEFQREMSREEEGIQDKIGLFNIAEQWRVDNQEQKAFEYFEKSILAGSRSGAFNQLIDVWILGPLRQDYWWKSNSTHQLDSSFSLGKRVEKIITLCEEMVPDQLEELKDLCEQIENALTGTRAASDNVYKNQIQEMKAVFEEHDLWPTTEFHPVI